MHDKSKKPEQAKKPIRWRLSRRTTMLMTFARWISHVKMLDSIEKQKRLLENLKEAYLLSDQADDRKDRDQMLVFFKHLEELLSLMASFNEEDYRKMNNWLEEMACLIQNKLYHEVSK